MSCSTWDSCVLCEGLWVVGEGPFVGHRHPSEASCRLHVLLNLRGSVTAVTAIKGSCKARQRPVVQARRVREEQRLEACCEQPVSTSSWGIREQPSAALIP